MSETPPTPTRITDDQVIRARDAYAERLCERDRGLALVSSEAMRAALEAAALPPAPTIDRDALEEAFIDAYLVAADRHIKERMAEIRAMETPTYLTEEQRAQYRRDAIRAPFRAAIAALTTEEDAHGQ